MSENDSNYIAATEDLETLQYQTEDACTQSDSIDKVLKDVMLEEENEELTEVMDALYTRAENLENKVNELQTENDGLIYEIGSLIIEAQEARRSFTSLQIAVSLLVFVYGMLYGSYFNAC